MAVPISGCPSGTPTFEKKKKRIHQEPSVPKEKCAGGNNHFSAQSLFEIFCFVVLYTVHTLKNVIKLEATGRPKSPRQQVREIVWVKLNGDKETATFARAYSLFYKNSGIEITSLSPNIDILIHFSVYR